MINCPSCTHFNGERCDRFGRQPSMAVCHYAEERKPRNNYERVKQMTMEELAVLFNGCESEGRAYGPKGKVAWLKWLNAEVE